MRALLLAALLSLAPLSAFAGSWDLGCDGNTASGQLTLSGGQVACYDPTANDDHSPLFAASDCENVDVALFDDVDGDATACTVTWEIELCPDNTLTGTALTNSCELAAGTAALSGDDVESNIAVLMWARLKGDGAGAEATSCRLMVKCAQVAR